MTDEIMGYKITKSTEALDAFLVLARQRYAALAEAVALIDEKLEDLERDWLPRPQVFWMPVLQTAIPAIRETMQNCFALFEKEQSKMEPIPLSICGAAIGYHFGLQSIEQEIEACGVVLTAYLLDFSQERSTESQIRARQRNKSFLQKLSKAVHKAIEDASKKFEEALEHQRVLFGPRRHAPFIEGQIVVEEVHAD